MCRCQTTTYYNPYILLTVLMCQYHMCFIDRKIVRSDPKWNEMKGTLYAVDSLEFKKMRPRRRLAEVKGTNLLSTSSYEFQAESRSYESKSTGHYEALPLNSFILAQVHFFFFFFFFVLSSISHTRQCYLHADLLRTKLIWSKQELLILVII